jgi:glycosyltransferase involved in cell wall biosynthesis
MSPTPPRTLVKELLDLAKCWIDVPLGLASQFQQDRASGSYQATFNKTDPLVSVCVGTYNRAKLLSERCVPSILAQSYRNIELIVVGDGCTDDTTERLGKITDERLHFTNLPDRGQYPQNPRFRWMVAGTHSVNHALRMARGDFIAHLDDDDEYFPNRVEELVDFMMDRRLDLAWHPFYMQNQDGSWTLRSCETLEMGSITTSSCFYHHWLRRIEWDINAYKLLEAGDWNRFRKFRYIGVEAARHPEALLRHYKERNQQTD